MKKYPKPINCDKRGQLVIPKDVRADLGIDEGTGFWVYIVEDEGILITKIDVKALEDYKEIIDELEEKSDKLGIEKRNLDRSLKHYKKTQEGGLEVI